MQNQHLSLPSWFKLSLTLLLVGVFGLGLKLVLAATFENPTCDPAVDLTCNVEKPLFLNTKDPNAAQQILTPVTIGVAGTPKNLNLYGGLILSESGQGISTVSGYSGIPINVASANEHGVYGTASTAGKYALYGAGTNSASGVFASTVDGNAIYAQAIAPAGFAGTFIGNVDINGTLSVDSLTVGGQSIGGGDETLLETLTASQIDKSINIKDGVFGGNAYRLESYQILYSLAGAPTDSTWLLLPQDKSEYRECAAGVFSGNLLVDNPTAQNIKIRVKILYSSQTVSCSGDTTPPEAPTIAVSPEFFNPNVSRNYIGQGSVTITATSPDAATEEIAEITIKIQNGANAAQLVQTCTSSPCVYNWNTTGLTAVQTIYAQAKNTSDLLSPESNRLDYIDYTNPVLAFNVPSANPATVSSQITLTTQVLDSGSGLKDMPNGVKYYICTSTPCNDTTGILLTDFSNNRNYATLTSGTVFNGFWNLVLNTTDRVNGTYYVVAVAEDNVGRKGTASKTLNYNNNPICGASSCYTIPNTTIHETSCCVGSYQCYNPVTHYCCSGVVGSSPCVPPGGG
ncbi:hypothetical protein C4546_02585 [Candidatus Parcubacteria bacterium]|jgi:hypothetical protein|nr:MAG: hypothetical protein C4546_02585 [Candidatus Parcubacteria bacterium]